MPASKAKLVKPLALRPGDTIGIIAPASNIKRAELESGCEALRRSGYKPVYLDSILDRDLYFAGSIDRRVRELEEMFQREDVRAIVCARGGYGANYLLNRLDLKKIRAHPKAFIGYSDVTCLLTHFTDTGLITFHGPMAAKDWAHDNGVDLESWQSALSQTAPWNVPLNKEARTLIDGQAEGVLYGGCLSIIVASLGTPYQINTAGKILFLEDIGAKPYQIDRMLMQLKIGGYLNNVRGLIFGEMLDCIQSANQDYTLEDVITRIIGGLNIPVVYGVRSGHVSGRNITLPFGVMARMAARADEVSLKTLESAISG
jgi:muramoyltetrapeptide carboxypeptidase